VLMEIGPQPVLTAAALHAWPESVTRPQPIASLRRGRADHRQISEALAAAYVAGHRPDFSAFHQGPATTVDLPTYPFQHRRYWCDEKREDSVAADPVRTETVMLLEEGRIEELAALFDGATASSVRLLKQLAAQHNQQRSVLSIADAVREQQLDCTILSVDIISPTTKQAWPIEIEGVQQDMQASIDDIWSRHVEEDLRKRILLRTGKTTSVLPALVKQGRKFDVIFIDAGHDVFSVIHDLSYAAVLLATDGAILLDDFAPLEEFGIGTCIAVAHARRWFGQVETFATEGLVYGGAAVAGAPRGMALIKGPFEPHPHVRRSSFVWWRFAAAVLARCYRPAVFPLAQ